MKTLAYIDSCVANKGNGEMLKITDTWTCPKNSTTGEWMDFCPPTSQIKMTVEEVFQEKVIKHIDNMFFRVSGSAMNLPSIT